MKNLSANLRPKQSLSASVALLNEATDNIKAIALQQLKCGQVERGHQLLRMAASVYAFGATWKYAARKARKQRVGV